MKPEDESALKRAADRASSAAQQTFLILNVAQLSLLAATALVSGWNPAQHDLQRGVAIAVFLMMTTALAVALALQLGRFDDKWFRCRAIAENAKSAMWYFVMHEHASPSGSEVTFVRQLQEIQERFPGLAKELAVHRPKGEEISDWMRQTQRLDPVAKMEVYRRDRVDDQVSWYQDRAKHNALREAQWQWAVFVLEFLAIAYAALQAWQLWSFNVLGGMAAISTTFVAWSQTKRHSDLANSYGVALEDLRRIAASQPLPLTESGARQFVRDVETAISREHSMWLARRAV